jgi:uncharacterized protein (TIGR02646 family)
MRQVFRETLPTRAQHFLQQCKADNTEWESARGWVGFKPVHTALRRMAGKRLRCMYCVDSAAPQVEHFKPKGKYPNDTFDWSNLLLACSGCNGHKWEHFPLDVHGHPLLIDPSTENPWDHLLYIHKTGYITGGKSPKGIKTVEILNLGSISREELTEGRKTTYSRLVNAILTNPNSTPEALVTKLIDADDHGLLGWCFSPQGKRQVPFDRLTDSHLHIWLSLTHPEEPPCQLR